MFGSSLPLCCFGVHVLIMIFVFIYGHWCLTLFAFQMMFLSFKSNTTDVTSGEGTANPSRGPGFYLGSCYPIFSFMCVFCRSLLSFCPFLLAIVQYVLIFTFDVLQGLCSGRVSMLSTW